MSDPYAPPELVTLDKPASWLNARGNIDRSACVEVRIGAYRRLVGLMSERPVKVWDEDQDKHVWKWLVEPMPRETPAVSRHGRVSSGVVWFDVWTLEEMLYRRVHRPLAGDWRTQRAPAVRAENWTRDERHAKKRGVAWKGFRNRVSMNDRWVEGGPPTAGTPGQPAGRTLVCRSCLGVKYGNNPETIRRGARQIRAKRRAAKEAAAQAERRKRHGPGTLSWVRKANDAIAPTDAVGEETG